MTRFRRRASIRRMVRFAIASALLVTVSAGCTGGGLLPGLGESCSLLCATGLTCSSARVCVKGCHCDGGALCNNSSLATGCPPEATCVANAPSGEGACAVLCADLGCPVGEGACAAAPDGTPVCVGPNFPWVTFDGGLGN